MLEQGLVQIYTGKGKGKTTAALGLALRAAGAGGKVLIYQFLKPPSLDIAERAALRVIDNITLDILPQPWDMRKSFDDEGIVKQTRKNIAKACKQLAAEAAKKKYDLIILDEIVFCLSKGLVELNSIKDMIDNRDKTVEIVMTGRGATKELTALADLVTEMKMIKHPFQKGIGARKGIEY